ncbi:hypothetical protein AVDCRST_MAG82-57, partial [uncultured Rubrobacteraceae bacterium]
DQTPAHRVRPRAGKPRRHGGAGRRGSPGQGGARSRPRNFWLFLHPRYRRARHGPLAHSRSSNCRYRLGHASSPRPNRGPGCGPRGGLPGGGAADLGDRANQEAWLASAETKRPEGTGSDLPCRRGDALRARGDHRPYLRLSRGDRRTLGPLLVGSRRPLDVDPGQPRPARPGASLRAERRERAGRDLGPNLVGEDKPVDGSRGHGRTFSRGDAPPARCSLVLPHGRPLLALV